MGNEDEKRILSDQEMLHLQSDKNEKAGKIMPDVDTSRYVLYQKPKTEAARNFESTAKITEEQRRQFHQGDTSASRNTTLAEHARGAIKIAQLHAEEEAKKLTKAAEKKTAKTAEKTDKLANEIRAGNFDFIFNELTKTP